VQRVRAALGQHVDYAAGGLAVLSLVTAGLDLDLFHEIERRGVAQRPEYDRVGPERAIPLVRDVDAVDDVLILETARAGD
jgi:hypothetical protein